MRPITAVKMRLDVYNMFTQDSQVRLNEQDRPTNRHRQ